MKSAETEIATVRGELEILRKALKLQTKRCRHLVTEYTRKLQEKERQYQSEKMLREDQLARVLRALLIFEARLKQEQKFISYQLNEKDYIIRKQNGEIKRLMSEGFCKNCNANFESLDSSSEYVITDYQSSNFESLDSSSETYATISEKDESTAKNKESPKRGQDRTYFEVLKMRNNNISPFSNEDNTSNDYDNLESLPAESVSDSLSTVLPKNDGNDSSSFLSVSDYSTVVPKSEAENFTAAKISEVIPVFEADNDANDNWYASASDADDDEHRNVYRNNPVLECMNQILLQNINDNINSPPKTPNLERKVQKRVKFSDEEEKNNVENNYYETPIQKVPNFYETPQSIYSNDYEQILSKSSEKSTEKSEKSNHLYIDMDVKSEAEEKVVRKNKILRTPPALPPKPVNLISKYKMKNQNKPASSLQQNNLDSEPDYCSISELNLPTKQFVKKISVVAEINTTTTKPEQEIPKYDPVLSEPLIASKTIEKPTIQLAKQTNINPKRKEPEIPKLPQVSEIIIPDETEPETKQDERITSDNYVKNNSQILKMKHNRHPIMLGSSVSALISGFNKHQLINEIKTVSKKPSEITEQKESDFDKFDLSQNFEEFKLDDCEIEEETQKEPEVDAAVPKLSVDSVEQFRKQLMLTSGGKLNSAPTYEHFLECTGLSSKSIVTPSRLLSNHKSMLKPKDVKLRSRATRANGVERQGNGGSTVKYWSEPFI